MAHSNPAKIENRCLKIDRKFLVGMERYVQRVRAPIVAVHPELSERTALMDPVEVPCDDLPFRIMTVKVDNWGRATPGDMLRLSDAISRCRLVYGDAISATALAQTLRVPYIRILEHDLSTLIALSSSRSKNPLRKANATIQGAYHYFATMVPQMRRAHSLHCNGYPSYDAAAPYNPNRLLYLDSRMSEEYLISPQQLAARLAGHASRPIRLLYSGRYESLKGTDDAVRVGLQCLRRGLDIEMHLYGQGSLRAKMEQLARLPAAAGRIHIHDAVSFPELVKISRTFDMFICCHVQNDPSCTYLESFGAGLPIVGYANRMWTGLARHSGAGIVARIRNPESVAVEVQRLIADREALAILSSKALAFASEHCFEHEFARRTEALNAALQ